MHNHAPFGASAEIERTMGSLLEPFATDMAAFGKSIGFTVMEIGVIRRASHIISTRGSQAMMISEPDMKLTVSKLWWENVSQFSL